MSGDTFAAQLLLGEAVVLLIVWVTVALMMRTEEHMERKPVVLLLVVAVTAAFVLQVVTAIVPALSTTFPALNENVAAIQLVAGILRGVALVLLLAYVVYRLEEQSDKEKEK